MRPVERSQFLELTRALVAKSRVSATATAATVVVAACGPGGAVDGAPVAIPKQPLAPSRAIPKVARAASSGIPRGEAPPAPTDEGDHEPYDDMPDTCGEVDTRNVARPQGACNDATPVAVVCSGCAKVGFGATKCASLSKALKPKVAKAAADCIARLPPSCDPCAIYACGDRAMKASCPDPTADVREVGLGYFRFFDNLTVDLGAGSLSQEPIQLAVRSVIERAVVEMMSNIYGVPGASVCKNAFGPKGDPMGTIGTTGAFIPRSEATFGNGDLREDADAWHKLKDASDATGKGGLRGRKE